MENTTSPLTFPAFVALSFPKTCSPARPAHTTPATGMTRWLGGQRSGRRARRAARRPKHFFGIRFRAIGKRLRWSRTTGKRAVNSYPSCSYSHLCCFRCSWFFPSFSSFLFLVPSSFLCSLLSLLLFTADVGVLVLDADCALVFVVGAVFLSLHPKLLSSRRRYPRRLQLTQPG